MNTAAKGEGCLGGRVVLWARRASGAEPAEARGVEAERPKNKRVTFFRAWGRLGTRQGDKRISEMSLAAAKAEFCEHFLAKTGNEWENRANFRKQPRMVDWVDVAYDDGANDSAQLAYVCSCLPCARMPVVD